MRGYQYDVVVAGGGAAGVAAAVGARKAGARTLLVERNPYLGGEATHSGVAAFCGFYTCGSNPVKVVDGVGGLVLKEMESLGPTLDYIVSPTGNKNINFQPEYLKCALDNLVEKEEVSCFLHTRIIAAKAEDGRLCSIICSDDEGVFAVEASCFCRCDTGTRTWPICAVRKPYGGMNKAMSRPLPFRFASAVLTRPAICLLPQ